jgi:hypothetical protein
MTPPLNNHFEPRGISDLYVISAKRLEKRSANQEVLVLFQNQIC